jgi:8-oxo-dGTP pyrophosphatase MutT (NUDIX family)
VSEASRGSADRAAEEDPRRRLEDIRRRIGAADARRVDLTAEPARAAVGVILEPRADDLYLFFIHRAVDERDRWSGQMAFPGGFHESTDADLPATVHREVLEEVGIDLQASAESIGRLDEIQGVARGRQLALVITPFLFALRAPVEPKPNEEVQGVLWVPLSYFEDPRNETEIEYPERPPSVRLPAFIYQGRTIWGLTLRMVKNFVERIGGA